MKDHIGTHLTDRCGRVDFLLHVLLSCHSQFFIYLDEEYLSVFFKFPLPRYYMKRMENRMATREF